MSGETATKSCSWDSRWMARSLLPILMAVPQRSIQIDKSQPGSQYMFLNIPRFPLAQTPCVCPHKDWMHHVDELKNSYMRSCHMEEPSNIGLCDVLGEPVTMLSQIQSPAWYHAPQGPLSHHTPASAISDPSMVSTMNLWDDALSARTWTMKSRLESGWLSPVCGWWKPKRY